ncbi:hypothetical protein ELY21_07535 [Legionella sp. km535]|uniref:hypothetical protein n=1 Tax=Legionella sp. km535 TaxID=2498107 RepID=UPI000F8CC2FF|nr:hypothetical protein [Legionella sp. km535]RUR18542.1 hypothetical protein ELY21_07535 [Legionella sp. km535]
MLTKSLLNTDINPIIKPVNELMELNFKTMQRLTYITPVDFLSVRKPEDILHKNMNALIKNGQTVLDYVQDMFHLFEENLFSNQNGDVLMKSSLAPLFSAVGHEISSTAKTSKHSVRTGVSKSKKSAKTSTMKAKSAVKKSVSPVHISKASASGQSNVHPVNKTGVMKQAAKKPSPTLKEATKTEVKPELSKVSSSITNPLIKLSPDSNKDSLK